MDATGRVVLPKTIREEAGFRPGYPLEISSEEGRVEIRSAPLEVEILDAEDGLPVAMPKEPVDTLTAKMVRETVESLRSERGER